MIQFKILNIKFNGIKIKITSQDSNIGQHSRTIHLEKCLGWVPKEGDSFEILGKRGEGENMGDGCVVEIMESETLTNSIVLGPQMKKNNKSEEQVFLIKFLSSQFD